MQDKKEAPRGGKPQPAHGNGRPTPGAEAPGWASSLFGACTAPIARSRTWGWWRCCSSRAQWPAAWGLTLNLTTSLPRGVSQRVDPALKRGSLVLVCLPLGWAALVLERGYLGRGPGPENTQPLGKRIGVVPGDEVEWASGGLRVNTLSRSAERPALCAILEVQDDGGGSGCGEQPYSKIPTALHRAGAGARRPCAACG